MQKLPLGSAIRARVAGYRPGPEEKFQLGR